MTFSHRSHPLDKPHEHWLFGANGGCEIRMSGAPKSPYRTVGSRPELNGRAALQRPRPGTGGMSSGATSRVPACSLATSSTLRSPDRRRTDGSTI